MGNKLIYIIFFILILLSISIFFCIKFALIILKMQDVIEDSLDVLDEKYAKISEILNIPIFFDSREIRDVLKEINGVRDSILNIAQKLTNRDDLEEDDDINGDN
jgi:hypothetical protein